MKINSKNYEAFFLDYVEGRLDNASTLEMFAFLRYHPNLKEELENFANITLSPSDVLYQEKEQLKKFEFNGSFIDKGNFDDYCIAYYEKLLSPQVAEKLLSYVNDDAGRKDVFLQYSKTILKADPSIVYEGKPFLKKKHLPGVRTIVLRLMAVAAGVLVLVAVIYKSPVKQNVVPVSKYSLKQNKSDSITPVISSVKEIAKTSDKTMRYLSNPAPDYTKQASIPEEEEQPKNDLSLDYLTPISSAIALENSGIERPSISNSSLNISEKISESEDFELMEYAHSMIKEKVFRSKDKSSRRLSLWDLADVTLKGYNQISEKDIILHRKTDENGKLTAIAIETENRLYGIETKN